MLDASRTMGQIVSDLSQMFRPPRRISVCDAAMADFHLPEGGKYDVATTPYMKEPMNLITDRSISTIVFVGVARSGKSLALVTAPQVYIITCNPSDTLVVHMTEASARRYSRLTVAKMIRNSPKIQALLSPSKDDNNILAKFFRNGMALMIGHPSPTQLSAADYKFVFLSDYDRMPEDNGEGSIFIQASKRTQTFMSAGCTVVESSPGRDFVDTEWVKSGEHEAPPVGGILGLYNEGDRRLQYWTCPHCSEDFPLYPGLELFQLPPQSELIEELEEFGAREISKKYAKIWCPNHGCMIEERDKNKLNQDAVWKAETDKPNSTASFWLSGYAATFQTWGSILEKEFKALLDYVQTGEESKLKATRNVDQSIPYMPINISTKMSAKVLQDRAEELPVREVPEGVRFLIGTIDVQIRSFVVHIEGFGVGLESWLVDRFVIDLSEREQVIGTGRMAVCNPPSFIEDWNMLLDKVINARYPLHNDEQGRDMGVLMTGCDSHGAAGVTENAYKFWKKIKALGKEDSFTLLRGLRPSPNATTPMVSQVILDKSSSAARKAKVVGEKALWNVNTTLHKDLVMANLGRDTFGSNYIHLPAHLPIAFFNEIVAETRNDKGWDNLSGRSNEAFDLLSYARAIVKIKTMSHWQKEINWDSPPPWADIWDKNSKVSNEKQREETRKAIKKTGGRSVRMQSSMR